MKRYIAISLLLFAVSCDTSEPPSGGEPSVQFAAVDASCTEVWLQVKMLAGVPERTVLIQRDSTTILNATITASETLIVDEGLLPNRSYSYALLHETGIGEERVGSSIATLDTTRHNFTWQSDTLGDGSSILYDVAVINDTLAYAVGAIYLRDSLGNWDPNAYNAAKWNGTRWELKRIPFIGPCSAVMHPPIKAIWAFSENNILVTNGGSIVSYDGVNATMDCGMNSLLTGAINKIYGVSPQDVYAVGNIGTIVHYTSGSWQAMESGTSLPFNDIWGELDGEANHFFAISIASNKYLNEGRKVLSLEAGRLEILSDDGLPWSLSSVWFVPGRKYYLAGDGLFSTNSLQSSWHQDFTLPVLYKHCIRGSGLNDIVVVGSYGLLSHFNGMNWKNFQGNGLPSVDGGYLSVALHSNMAVAVGFTQNQAIALIGRR